MSPVLSREQIIELVESARKQGRSVGFTSGVFDILHVGHARYLDRARQQVELLIVAVNSDNSVAELKGARRPIVSAKERAALVASLQSVDAVFIFDDLNNNRNVELIKPDIYFKAGDYTISKLSSAPIVEKHGGRVVVIAAEAGCSSSNIISTIVDRYTQPEQLAIKSPPIAPRPALFVDRDGTLIELVDYLHDAKKVKLIKRAVEVLKVLANKGYAIVIVTNQAGIGLGYFSVEDFFKVNRHMLTELKAHGVMVDKVYFCPHNERDQCECRKPKADMLERAARELNLIRNRCIMVGDFQSDVDAANNFGCQGVLIKQPEDWDKVLALANTSL